MPSRRVLAALMLALPLGGSEPAMAAGDRQAVRATFTAVKPKASTGTRIEMTFRNPRDPSGKPYAVDDVVIVSPPGTRFDHDAIPKCRASDAELMLRGVAGCPSASKVQAGRMTLDTGSPLAVPRIMRFRTATFNASGGFVSVGDAENFPFRGVVRSRTDGRVTRVDYADAAGYGGPDSYSAMRTMLTSGPPLGTESRPFMRAPSSCPRRGRWTTRFIFIYHDGERATERTRSRCRRRRPEGRLTSRTARQDLDMRFTSREAGVSTGTLTSIEFRDPKNPEGKPIPVRREKFVLPRGTRFRPSVVPHCTASEQELATFGEAACPSETRVGEGVARAISGSPFDPIAIEIDAFENGSGFALVSEVSGLGMRFVTEAVRRGRTIAVAYPRAPGGPPDGESALREVHNRFAARGSRAVAYTRTPRTCPPRGRWRFVGRFTYADGVTERAVSRQRCRGAIGDSPR